MTRPSAQANGPRKPRSARSEIAALKPGASPLQGSAAAAADRRGADRIEAETDVGGGGREAAALHQAASQSAASRVVRAEIEIERDAGIEVNAVERARDRLIRRGEPVAVGADRAGEDQREPGRAVLEIVQRLRIGRRRIGMVDALHDRPRRAGCAPGDRAALRPCGRRAARWRARHRSWRRASCRTARP